MKTYICLLGFGNGDAACRHLLEGVVVVLRSCRSDLGKVLACSRLLLYVLICFVRGRPRHTVSFGRVFCSVALYIKRGENLFREEEKDLRAHTILFLQLKDCTSFSIWHFDWPIISEPNIHFEYSYIFSY